MPVNQYDVFPKRCHKLFIFNNLIKHVTPLCQNTVLAEGQGMNLQIYRNEPTIYKKSAPAVKPERIYVSIGLGQAPLFFISSSRKTFRRILPTLLFGSSSRNSISFGHL